MDTENSLTQDVLLPMIFEKEYSLTPDDTLDDDTQVSEPNYPIFQLTNIRQSTSTNGTLCHVLTLSDGNFEAPNFVVDGVISDSIGEGKLKIYMRIELQKIASVTFVRRDGIKHSMVKTLRFAVKAKPPTTKIGTPMMVKYYYPLDSNALGVPAKDLAKIRLPIVVQVMKMTDERGSIVKLQISDGKWKFDNIYVSKSLIDPYYNDVTKTSKFKENVFIRITAWEEKQSAFTGVVKLIITQFDLMMNPKYQIGNPKTFVYIVPSPDLFEANTQLETGGPAHAGPSEAKKTWRDDHDYDVAQDEIFKGVDLSYLMPKLPESKAVTDDDVSRGGGSGNCEEILNV